MSDAGALLFWAGASVVAFDVVGLTAAGLVLTVGGLMESIHRSLRGGE